MKKYFFLIAFFVATTASAQTYIKYNLVTTAVFGAFNPSIETHLYNRWTVDYSVLMTFRNETSHKGPFRILNQQVDARYYFNDAFKGFFIGPNFGYGMFRLTKPSWNFWYDKNDYEKNHEYQSGWVLQAGFTTGWEHQFKNRWLVEAFVGFGFINYKYETFKFPNGERVTNLDTEFHHEFWPYKGGINIGYLLGGSKNSRHEVLKRNHRNYTKYVNE